MPLGLLLDSSISEFSTDSASADFSSGFVSACFRSPSIHRFCIGIIHHEVRRIPRWVPSVDYGKCFTYRGLIFGLSHEFSHNLISHVGMYTNEKKWNCVPYRFVRGVDQGQFTTISFMHSLLSWLLMYKGVPGLGSSFSLTTASLVGKTSYFWET